MRKKKGERLHFYNLSPLYIHSEGAGLFSVLLFVFSNELVLDVTRNEFVRSKLHDE